MLLARAIARSKVGAASTMLEKLAEEAKAYVAYYPQNCIDKDLQALGTSIHHGNMLFGSCEYHLRSKMQLMLRG